MKILVLSDSHGNLSNMEAAVQREQPQQIFHLGDCWQDGEELHAMFPNLPFEQVPGNCDYRSSEPQEKLLELNNQRILLCHGHTYHVKLSLMEAEYAAQSMQLNLFLFGHTHRSLWDLRGSTVFLNPGSIGDYAHPSYGIVQISNGQLNASIVPLFRN